MAPVAVEREAPRVCAVVFEELRRRTKKTLDFRGKTILAPLTTVGNLPFRRICVQQGVDVTVGEMALAESILQGGKTELSLLRRHKDEKCFGIQVAGGFPETMASLAQFVDEHVDCDFVDINMGCPLEGMHKKGCGSALMSRHRALQGVVRTMSSILTCPLTIKFRTAHFEKVQCAHKLIPKLEEWGVSAMTLHGRTAKQRYLKTADWDYIAQCAKIPQTCPLIGNGDVLSWEEAQDRFARTQGIMIGRGALIKPWIFTELKEKRHWDISATERLDILKDFTNFGLEHWGSDSRGVETTRRFMLEWLSFLCRYIPVGLLEVLPQHINMRPPPYFGRNDLETKMASQQAKDWVEITEMLLGPVPEGFSFTPKHKSASYESTSVSG